ncbi:MAG: hypothetical protein ACU841_06550 [Gammaproteobacteria bacterium]
MQKSAQVRYNTRGEHHVINYAEYVPNHVNLPISDWPIENGWKWRAVETWHAPILCYWLRSAHQYSASTFSAALCCVSIRGLPPRPKKRSVSGSKDPFGHTHANSIDIFIGRFVRFGRRFGEGVQKVRFERREQAKKGGTSRVMS